MGDSDKDSKAAEEKQEMQDILRSLFESKKRVKTKDKSVDREGAEKDRE